MSNNNLEIKLTNQDVDNEQIQEIQKSFNEVLNVNLIKFTLDYIYDIKLNHMDGFDWDSHLINNQPFDCDVYFQSIKIGTIQLISFKGKKFINIIYATPFKHKLMMTEFNPGDRYYWVSRFESDHLKCKFELGYAHPSKNDHGCVCQRKTDYDCDFSYTFNAIALENDVLNFVKIENKKPEEHDVEIVAGFDNKFSFEGYKLKEANFEDALKSLLLLHIVINKLDGEYNPNIGVPGFSYDELVHAINQDMSYKKSIDEINSKQNDNYTDNICVIL